MMLYHVSKMFWKLIWHHKSTTKLFISVIQQLHSKLHPKGVITMQITINNKMFIITLL